MDDNEKAWARRTWLVRAAAVLLTLYATQEIIIEFVLRYLAPMTSADRIAVYSTPLLGLVAYVSTAWALLALARLWRLRPLVIGAGIACALAVFNLYFGLQILFALAGHPDAFPLPPLGTRGRLIISLIPAAFELAFLLSLAWACFVLGGGVRRSWAMRACGALFVAWSVLWVYQAGLSVAEFLTTGHADAFSLLWHVSDWAEHGLGVVSFVACGAAVVASRRIAVDPRTRGWCPMCHYDLAHDFHRGCPECGWGRSTRSA